MLLFIPKGIEFESYSQHRVCKNALTDGCCLYLKVLNLKAIHNIPMAWMYACMVVVYT